MIEKVAPIPDRVLIPLSLFPDIVYAPYPNKYNIPLFPVTVYAPIS